MNRRQVLAAVAVVGAILMAAPPAAGQTAAPDFLPGSGAGGEQLLLEASAVPSQTAVVPGETFHVAVRITVGKGWVFYSPAPGGGDVFVPVPARLTVEAAGWRVEPALWPGDQEHRTPVGETPVTTFVYTGTIVAYVPIAVPSDASLGTQDMRVQVTGLVCSDTQFKCVPVRGEALATVDVGPVAAGNPAWTDALRRGVASAVPADSLRGAPQPVPTSKPTPTELSLWGGLGLAALAGLILNIMPCVLPVIPVRILSVVELARQSRRRYVTVGLTFALGIVLLFVGLAAANVILRQELGRELDWGRHFQYAPFRLGMAMVVVAMAANLFGVFAVFVPRRLVELDGSIRTQGHMASLGMGLMMAILSTPCSFAVLVVAIAWAQVQPLWLGSLAIVMIGVGMAAPHVLLAACPWLIGWLPRPGRWMELLRQAMGFALLGVAVWLIGTLSSDARIVWTLGYGVALVFCLWIWGTVVRYTWPTGAKMLVRWLAVVAAVAAGAWMLTPPKGLAVHFQPFDEARITQATRAGKIVLVDFTAAWCLSCKLVDFFLYDRPEVAAELEDRGVLAMRGDVTSADAPANELLYDRLGGAPPLTVIYPPSGPPIRLEGKFSPLDLTRALDQAAPRQSQPAD